MESSGVASLRDLVGRRVALPGHFVDAVIIEDARPLGSGAELRVRLTTGEFDRGADGWQATGEAGMNDI